MSDYENRTVVGFQQQGIARTFCNILKNEKIGAVVQTQSLSRGMQYIVIVDSTSDVYRAQGLAREFIENPQQTKFQQAAWETGQTYDSIKLPNMSFNLASLSAIPFTSFVMLACIGVYVAFFLGYFDALYDALTIQPLTELATNHQWWRLFGPNFLHFGIAHIAFNLLWWWILGTKLERIFGTFWLVVLFVVASLCANITQLIATGPNFGGMSGVVYALFGFVWWIGRLRPSWGVSIPNPYIIFLLGWLALGFLSVLPVNMANQAHLFGLISGCLLAFLLHAFVGKNERVN
ncbi:MAG: rhomboid family intramembrane serine protease GlpG [Pseudomonadota bacterium]